EDQFTVPLYRHILSKALGYLDQDGQVILQAASEALRQDSYYESIISQLSVWDLYLEDVSVHVAGCFRVLEKNYLQRVMEELIGRVKVAERDGSQELVDALNMEINCVREKKALWTVSS